MLQERDYQIAEKILNDIVTNFIQNKNNTISNTSECAGTYPVSGYTREDGTEVRGYIRTCGAAHAGNSQSSKNVKKETYKQNNEENDWHNVELDEIDRLLYKDIADYTNMLQDGSVLEGRVEKFGDNKLSVVEAVQKEAAQLDAGNEQLPAKDYYKIALDLAENPEKVVSNDRNQVYKSGNLPESLNQKVVFDKIAQGLKIDANNPNNIEVFKNTTVVAPEPDSKLIQVIKRSDKIKNLIKSEYENIVNGEYKNQYFKNGLAFEAPGGEKIFSKQWRDKMTLFGVLHNVDIYDLKQDADDSITLIISDYFDFEHWNINKKDNLFNIGIKYVNNNANNQQNRGRLEPYILYIPIRFSQEELREQFFK